MSIYLISNRKVTNGQFSNKGKERAKRDFRVATCKIIDKAPYVEYQIIPDNNLDGYKKVLETIGDNPKTDVSKLPGTVQMFADLYKQMLAVKDQQSDCLFFIHGFANKLESNFEHLKKLHDTYIKPKDSGIDHLVYVAWPSIGHKFLTYWNDQTDAEETGRILGGLFSKLFNFFIELFEIEGKDRCSNRIHLAAHSMGNTVLDYMLQNIPEHRLFNLFGEVLLLHSDVRHDIYEKNGSYRKLEQLAGRTHIYISRSDEVLSVLSEYTKNWKRRLGYRGPKKLSSLPADTFVVDTTNAGRASTFRESTFDHWGYTERKKVIEDIKLVLAGVDDDDLREKRKTSKKGDNYFILK